MYIYQELKKITPHTASSNPDLLSMLCFLSFALCSCLNFWHPPPYLEPNSFSSSFSFFFCLFPDCWRWICALPCFQAAPMGFMHGCCALPYPQVSHASRISSPRDREEEEEVPAEPRHKSMEEEKAMSVPCIPSFYLMNIIEFGRHFSFTMYLPVICNFAHSHFYPLFLVGTFLGIKIRD